MKKYYFKWLVLLLLLAPLSVAQAQNTGTNEPKTDEVYTCVENAPSFPGGEEAMYQFLADHIEYPATARENNITGTVYVTFVVEKNGKITNVVVKRDIGGGCGAEVVRVVNMMPRWKAATQKGKPVRCQFSLPVNFKLK